MPEPMRPTMRELQARLADCIAKHPQYADEEVVVQIVQDNPPASIEAIAVIFVTDWEPGSKPLVLAYLDRGPDDLDQVRRRDACPRCGERRQDWLIVQEDESVRCGTCGLVYRLPGDKEEGE